jgi:hypothetical protein
LNYGQDDRFLFTSCVFDTYGGLLFILFYFYFCRDSFYSQIPVQQCWFDAASIIISKGSSGCSFNKIAAGNIEAIYDLADTFK